MASTTATALFISFVHSILGYMDRRFFNLINVLLVIIIFLGMVQSILRLLIGGDLFLQAFFLTFFIIQLAVFIFMSALVLKYYWVKKYKPAFFVGIGVTLATLLHSSIVFLTLSTFTAQPLYLSTLVTGVGFTVIYGLTLALSNSGKRYWLKIGGIYLVIISLLIVASIIWMLSDQSPQTALIIEKYAPWLGMLSSVGPIFLIFNFIDEGRQLEKHSKASEDKLSSAIQEWLTIMLAIAALAFSIKISSDVYWSRHGSKKNFEDTKELVSQFEARTFVGSKGDTLYYRLLKPQNLDTTKTYPLLISLPYGGQPPTDKIRQLEGAAAAGLLSSPENRKKYPAFLFIPNCPAGAGWGGIPGYPSVDSLVYEAIISLNNEPGLDVKRRYVTGISRGGYGSWKFISTRPDLFAAAIPVCGGNDGPIAPGITKVAVWAFHGAKDTNVPVAGSRNMIKAIQKAGGRPKYTEYPDLAHNIWDQVSTTPGLWDWLFAQRQR